MPDHEIAKLCNSTPSIVGRYRRRYGIPAYEGYKFGMGQAPPSKKTKGDDDDAPDAEVEAAPVAEKPAKESTKGRSKLDAFRDIVGVLSDAEVAARAGVTAEAVRIYRRRHGLSSRRENAERAAASNAAAPAPAPTRASARAAAPAAATAEAPKAADADAGKKNPQRRSSKLDSYMDLVGTLPDREVATMAGVTPENVRAFRRRHNIPARWRNEGEEEVETMEAAPIAPVEAPAVVEAPEAVAPKAPKGKAAKAEAPKAEPKAPEAPKAEAPKVEAPKVEAPKAAAPAVETAKGAGLNGYAVHVRHGDLTHEYLIVASDIAAAANNALKAVGARHANAEITSIRHLGPALA